MVHIKTWILPLFFILLFDAAKCWDLDDLELFDLVEEVNENFYDLLGVSRTATSSEIKKAYRKKTLVLHPDKNEAEDAEEKFRQLVAVYEVLKDEEKKEKYNLVLENGLPDWRQPVYYYRKARKMGLLELAFVLCMVITVGQYFVLWAMYLEKRLALEDFFMSKRKRERRGKKKAAAINDQIEEDMQETLDSIPKPSPRDLWPLTFSVWVVRFTLSIPTRIRRRQERIQFEQELKHQRQLELEEQQRQELQMKEEQEQRKLKRKQKAETEVAPELVTGSAPVVYGMESQTPETQTDNTYKQLEKEGDWTDEDYVMLSKAYIKFPGGTTKRWEKIAEMVGRPVSEVTVKCKKMKGTYQMNLNSSVQAGIKVSKKNVAISDNIISTKEDDAPTKPLTSETQNETTVRKRHKQKTAKDSERTLMITKLNETTDQTASEGASSKDSGLLIKDSNLEINSKPSTTDKTADVTKTANAQSVASTANGTGKSKTVIKVDSENKAQKADSVKASSKNKKDAVKGATAVEDSDVWSQNQQVILEWALRQYPKGTDQRWEKVAEHIPGKTKEDCVARFKYLADLVKQKKQQA